MIERARPSKNPKHITSIFSIYFFFYNVILYAKCISLICHSTIAIPKKGNVGRHFWTVHKNYDAD